MSTSDTLTAALVYAEAGYAVFGLQPGTKRPYSRTNGFKDASTDSGVVAKWWTFRDVDDEEAWDSNIGNRPAPDELVIDVGVRADGYATLADRVIQLGALPENAPVDTDRDRWAAHSAVLRRWCPGRLSGPGVDIKGHNGYVVMPPSQRSSGATQATPGCRSVHTATPGRFRRTASRPWHPTRGVNVSASLSIGRSRKPMVGAHKPITTETRLPMLSAPTLHGPTFWSRTAGAASALALTQRVPAGDTRPQQRDGRPP